ncbi:MAG: hypothetical protein WCF85_16770, partial [Rhodospirillaceae bacterium]
MLRLTLLVLIMAMLPGVNPAPAATQAPVVGYRLVNTGHSVAPRHFITIGQVFIPGQLLPGEGLMAVHRGQSAGDTLPVQIDIKATHQDHSVRHAVLTFECPKLTAGESVDLTLLKREASSTEQPPAVTVNMILDRGYQASAVIRLGDGAPVIIDAARLLRAAAAEHPASVWLSGSAVTEVRVGFPLDRSLHIDFDIRGYADGRVRTDFIVANDATFSPDGGLHRYTVELRESDRSLFSATVAHQRNTTWHKELWNPAGDPAAFRDIRVIRDMTPVIRTGALPAYDTNRKKSSCNSPIPRSN